MCAEEKKAVIRRWIEAINARKWFDAAEECFAADHVGFNAAPDQTPGPEGVKQRLAPFLVAFPDLHFTIEEIVAEGDMVVARFMVKGTHQGMWLGIAPTGRRIRITWVSWAKVEGDKIVRSWSLFDGLTMMRQLGVLE